MSITTRRSGTTSSSSQTSHAASDLSEANWYGPGFFKFVQQLEETGSCKRANNKMAVILPVGVSAANITNAIKKKTCEHWLGDHAP